MALRGCHPKCQSGWEGIVDVPLANSPHDIVASADFKVMLKIEVINLKILGAIVAFQVQDVVVDLNGQARFVLEDVAPSRHCESTFIASQTDGPKRDWRYRGEKVLPGAPDSTPGFAFEHDRIRFRRVPVQSRSDRRQVPCVSSRTSGW